MSLLSDSVVGRLNPVVRIIMVMISLLFSTAQADQIRWHAREASKILFTGPSGSFFEEGFAIIEEKSTVNYTVYFDFSDEGNLYSSTMDADSVTFNLWGVEGMSTIGLLHDGSAYIDNQGNTSVLLGTGSFHEATLDNTDPFTVSAKVRGIFTASEEGVNTLELEYYTYSMTGDFLHYMFEDVFPLHLIPGNMATPIIGLTINDIIAKDVITLEPLSSPAFVVPVPGAVWLFSSALGLIVLSRRKATI